MRRDVRLMVIRMPQIAHHHISVSNAKTHAGNPLTKLAARDRVRETMGLVMGDLVPASRALDPRFVVELLR